MRTIGSWQKNTVPSGIACTSPSKCSSRSLCASWGKATLLYQPRISAPSKRSDSSSSRACSSRRPPGSGCQRAACARTARIPLHRAGLLAAGLQHLELIEVGQQRAHRLVIGALYAHRHVGRSQSIRARRHGLQAAHRAPMHINGRHVMRPRLFEYEVWIELPMPLPCANQLSADALHQPKSLQNWSARSPPSTCPDVKWSRGVPAFAMRDWHPSDHCSFKARGGPWPPHCVVRSSGAEFAQGLRLGTDARVVSKGTDAERGPTRGSQAPTWSTSCATRERAGSSWADLATERWPRDHSCAASMVRCRRCR